MKLTVSTIELRQALQAVLPHVHPDPDNKQHRIRFEITATGDLILSATQLYTVAVAYVSVMDNPTGEVETGWDISPATAKDILAVFKVDKDTVAEAQLLLEPRKEFLHLTDVGGLFPGKGAELPCTEHHPDFPDLGAIVRKHAARAGEAPVGHRATAGAYAAAFATSAKAFGEELLITPVVDNAGVLLVSIGERFIAAWATSSSPDHIEPLLEHRRRWLDILPSRPTTDDPEEQP